MSDIREDLKRWCLEASSVADAVRFQEALDEIDRLGKMNSGYKIILLNLKAAINDLVGMVP